jgi:hypothetical protein
MADTPPEHSWHYTRHGQSRHLLTRGDPEAACGRDPGGLAAWYGTGSQAEYETCAALPACRNCIALVPAAADWEVGT